MTSFSPHKSQGPPLRASSNKEEYLIDGACSLYFKQTISESGEQKGNWISKMNSS